MSCECLICEPDDLPERGRCGLLREELDEGCASCGTVTEGYVRLNAARTSIDRWSNAKSGSSRQMDVTSSATPIPRSSTSARVPVSRALAPAIC